MRQTLCLVAVTGMFAGAGIAQSPTPNTLLVIADDVGVDSITCYGLGSSPPPTPHIDALAQNGIRFTNAHACPTCSPTRASLLTGRHGFRTGIGVALTGQSNPGLAAGEVLLPEVLAPAGIATALIGKWHLGNDLGPATPTAEGFGTFTGNLQGSLPNYFQWQKVENGATSATTNYATTDCVDEALAFISQTSAPWCLVLSFHAGHSPYHAPPAGLHTQSLAGLDPDLTPIPFYKAMVEAMDSELGRLLWTMAPATRANTNVVFVGDNGTASPVVLPPFAASRSKGTVYQGGVRVPMIVAGPSVLGSPRVEPALVHVVDLMPTLATLQGVDAVAALPPGTAFDGVDFSSLLAAPGQPAVREILFSEEFAGSSAMAASGDSEVVRDARFELLRFRRSNGTIREEMYDLAVDPWETTDLLLQPLSPAASDARRVLLRELARLRGFAWSSGFGSGCSGGGVTPTLTATNTPVVNSTFQLQIGGLSAAAPISIGAIGFTDETWNGASLPVDLTVVGFTGCSLWIDPARLDPLVTIGGGATWSIGLPDSPPILGLSLFLQAFPLVPGANPAGLIATPALEAVVGF